MVQAVVHGVGPRSREGRIRRVTFGLLSDDEIRAYSVVEVHSTTVYNRGKPAPNGVNDLRMGTTDSALACSTCGNNVEDCTGHHGHIELPLPVYHGLYMDVILKSLRIACFWCSRPVREPAAADAHLDAEQRFLRMHTACRSATTCAHCGGVQPSFSLAPCGIAASWPQPLPETDDPLELAAMSDPFTAQTARDILEAISDADCRAMGLTPSVTRPENMVPSCLIVPPPCVRPAIVNDARSRAQDDLTHMLQSINKRARALRALLNGRSSGDRDHVFDRAARAHAEVQMRTDARVAGPEPGGADVGDVDAGDVAQADDLDDDMQDSALLETEVTDDEDDGGDDADEPVENVENDIDADNVADEDTCEDDGGADNPTAGGDASAVSEAWDRLQMEVCSLFNNTSRTRAQALQRSGAPTRTLKHRLSGKHGRVRENMMGKRCNDSARSVISPDPNIAIDEIGVPECVARVLTVPEPVNRHNIVELTQRVRIGPGRSDGAAAVITADGCVIDLDVCPAERRSTMQLTPATAGRRGDIVERYLTDGRAYGGCPDVVVFNRQPSLHRYGMMVHSVRILPGRTFRLNVAVTSPYNADFDGDEMNVHVPCSAASRVEASQLMKVSDLLISPQANRPVIGLVQDSLLGAYLLTGDDVVLTESQVDDILSSVRDSGRYWLPRRPERTYSGREVFSTLLPPIDLDRGAVRIVAGELRRGRVGKSVIGAAAGGIVQIIAQDYGTQRASRFLSDVQVVTLRYLAMRGFSMGIRDCAMVDPAHAATDVSAAITETRDIVSRVEGSAAGSSDRDVWQEAEAAVSRVCSGAIARVGERVRRNLTPSNSLLAMVDAGSKGNPVNYTQIMGCVGQQCISGGRIGVGGGVTLPCFSADDHSIAAHGFVASSYAEGLKPHELFYHAMGGREGLIDTAVCTAVTGYLQRRTVKGLEDKAVVHAPPSTVHAYRPVASASGHVVQLHYGGDGCDASRLERVALPDLLSPDDAVRRWAADDEAAEALLTLRARIIGDRRGYIGVGIEPHAHLPASVERLAVSAARAASNAETRQRPADAVAALMAFTERALHRCAAPMLYTILYWLCPGARVRRGLNDAVTVGLCHRLKRQIAGAMVDPGEMVGIVAAQMIGEPLTQLTLNTFHLAGVGNQTKGIARIKELVDCTRNPKTPCTQLSLHGRCNDSAGLLQVFSERLVHRTVSSVCQDYDVVQLSDCSQTLRLSLAIACASRGGPAAVAGRYRVVRMNIDFGAIHALELEPHHVAYAVSACCTGAYVGYDDASVALAWPFEPVEWAHADPDCVPASTWSPDVTNLLFAVGRKAMVTAVLCGVPGVTAATVRRVRGVAHGGATACSSVIEVHGLTLTRALALPYVDESRIVSNDVCDVLDVLGVEAARSVLLQELQSTISDDGTYVNVRHLMLLVDTMTQRGTLMPMSRHGINRTDPDETMKKCSYEETIDVLSKAALFGNADNMLGVTPSVAFGQCCPRMGTSSSTVLMHPRSIKSVDATKKRKLLVSTMTVHERPSSVVRPHARTTGSEMKAMRQVRSVRGAPIHTNVQRVAPVPQLKSPSGMCSERRIDIRTGQRYVPPSPRVQ